ncbi:MAG: endonuclease [Oscillospiraceae bacterium]|nr:endonuclease [Oscillospiraceae bacterium]
MTNLLKRSASFVLVLVLLACLLPGLRLPASAAVVDYQQDAQTGYLKNWGIRGELSTFLSPNAVDFYGEQGTAYEELAALDGAAEASQVPDSELYQQLYELMSGAHAVLTDYDDTRVMYAFTDSQNNGYSGTGISGFYSGMTLPAAWDGGLTWNREHTWPQSKSAGGSDIEDIMSIRPESMSVNSGRNNKAYGQSSGYYNPSELFPDAEDVRGDIARVVLYTYVRWGGESETVQGKLLGTDGVIESIEVLLTWIETDPVDTWEMGRNDAVESITGTRNVFVDYPELAYVLFDEQIPEMDTPSGMANEDPTIQATVNNSAWGSVTVNGGHIAAHPAAGYAVSGYELVSGNADVTQKGNVFTVSGDCTIRILFEEAAQHTARFVQDGRAISTETVFHNGYVSLPAFSGDLPEGYTFLGWVTANVDNATAKPAVIYPVGTEYVMQENTAFYALLSWLDTGTESDTLTYQRVTSQDQIKADTKVIIAAADYDKAMSTTQTTNNRSAADVTKNGTTLIFDDTVQVFTLKTGSVSGTYAFSADNKYLYAVNNSNNYLRTGNYLNDAASFYITVKPNGTTAITSAAYVSTTAGIGNVPMQYNTSGMFACYPKGTQKALVLYVGAAAGTVRYTTLWGDDCDHAGQYEIVTPPGCTTQGYTTYICDCGYSYVGSYTDSTGHSFGAWYTVTAATATQEGQQRRDCKNCDHYETRVVSKLPVISTQPVHKNLPAGKTAKFTVKATGTELKYQWQYRTSAKGSWKAASATGNKTATLSVPVTATRNGCQYRCKITDKYGNAVYSKAAALNVVTLKVTAQPANKFLPAGKTAKFTVKAAGEGLKYQWQYRTSAKGSWKTTSATGNKTATLSVPATATRNGYQYRCKITDQYGNVIYSGAATLKIVTLKITTQPASVTLAAGKTATFKVVAKGTGLTYQWQYRTSAKGSWKKASATGNKTATLKVPVTATRNGYQYRCVITDQYGNVINSAAATLKLKK